MTVLDIAVEGTILTSTFTANVNKKEPISEYLHVIAVLSNPCQFKRRFQLAREFIARQEATPGVVLYVVELAYNDDPFQITNSECARHLQLRTRERPIWVKETLVNAGIKYLLPPDCKAFAWIDADIEFENRNWVNEALVLLNGECDVIQLFSHALDLDAKEDPMNIFSSFAYQCNKGRRYSPRAQPLNQFHPGFAWAMRRDFLDKIGGQLYDLSILGAGDINMAWSFIGRGLETLDAQQTEGYKQSLRQFESRCSPPCKLGHVSGVIRHYFHGSKVNRRYGDRWKLLNDARFDPYVHLCRDEFGLVCASEKCPKKLLDDIALYFVTRNEDE